MKKRILSLCMALALCIGLLPVTALAAGEKEQYQNHPLFVDLNLDQTTTNDDGNFVVMKTGAVILDPTDGMSIDASVDGSEYVLRNPSQEAKTITMGTPVAFVDRGNGKAYFFLPTQVSSGTDTITFSCDPANSALEDLFQTFSLPYACSKDFSQAISHSNLDGTVRFTSFANRTYVAHWKRIGYNVFWLNWDGSYLDITENVYDEYPDYNGPTPTREPDDQFYYVFAGWMPEIKIVSEDAQYTAVYDGYNRLKFISSPQDVTLKVGETAVFCAKTDGGEGVTYQWYQIPAGVGAGGAQPISGETTDTLTLTAVDGMNGNRYYCVAQDTVGQQVVSGEARMVISTPAITTESLPDGEVGTAYSQTLTATGDTPIKWNLASGSTLPAGLSLSEDGKITGTPTTAGTYKFTVTASNESGSASKELC